MKLEYLDMPDVFRNAEIGKAFVEALLTNGLSLYYIKSVQIIVDHHWEFWRSKMHIVFGIPMLINMVTFLYYSYLVLPALFDGDESYEIDRTVCLVIMNSYSVYFLMNEVVVNINL